MPRQSSSASANLSQRQQVVTTAVLNASEIMELKQNTLAQTLGMSESTVSRMKDGKYLIKEGTKEWELAALLIRLFRGLDALVAGDETSLRSWLRGYNTALKETPINLLTSITGLTKTVEYVDAYRARV